MRGEEPVFVVTGRKEDVGLAKREILSAAEHFSQIRASRRNNNTGATGGTPTGVPGVLPGPGNPNLPGQVTIQVRVPYRVVGLVVGPKGATIKRIQQQTHTYIVTPNRDKEPIFEVTGLPENVEKARQEIEGHIAMRTGGATDGNLNNQINNLHSSMNNLNMLQGGQGNHGNGSKQGGGLDECRSDFQTNGIDAGFHELSNNLMFGSSYNKSQSGNHGNQGNHSNQANPGNSSAFTPYNKMNNNQSNNVLSQHMAGEGAMTHDSQMFPFNPHMDSGISKFSDMNQLSERITSGSVGLYDSDEGIGGSPTFDSTTLPLPTASIWSDLSSDSQASDFGTLFTGMQNSGSAATLPRQNLSLGNAPCLSLPHLSFNTLAASGDLPQMSMMEQESRRLNSDSLNLATTLALLQNGHAAVAGLQNATSPGSSTLASTCTSVTSSLSLSESSATSSLHSASSSPTEPTIVGSLLAPPPRGRHCMVCSDGDIVAALVPCGHNMFCMDCARKLVQEPEGHCPICHHTPTQAIRIFS